MKLQDRRRWTGKAGPDRRPVRPFQPGCAPLAPGTAPGHTPGALSL